VIRLPYKDIRQFISKLEDEGELFRVKKEMVSGDEISAVMWEFYERTGINSPAVMFEKVKGYDVPLVEGLFQSYARWALAMDMPNWRKATIRETQAHLMAKMENTKEWKDPKIVSSASCHENVLQGEKASLKKFPILKWHHDEGGPYVMLTGWINKDPEWGHNMGMYRCHVYDERTTGVVATEFQDIGMMIARARLRGEKEVELANAVGYPPVLHFCAPMKMPVIARDAEFKYGGALLGEPIELVKAETIDVKVPATSELVMEGKLSPTETRDEGPLCEWMGYCEEKVKTPVFRIHCLTHRNNPVYPSATTGHIYSENSTLSVLPRVAWISTLKRSVTGFRDAVVPLEGRLYGAVIQIKKRYPGWGKQAVLNALSTGFGQAILSWAIAVDEDIDIYNWNDVLTALSTRVDPELDVIILPAVANAPLAPQGRARLINPRTGFTDYAIFSKMGIDATKKFAEEDRRQRPTPNFSTPSPEWRRKVKEMWSQYGLKLPEEHKRDYFLKIYK